MKHIITVLAVFIICNSLQAQDYKFGKVPIEELTNNIYAQDTSASAVIPSYNYAELKEFYNQRVLKETEKVVLSKL